MPEDIGIIEEIERLLDAEPFMPFKIVMASGDRYEVTGPRQLAIGKSVVGLFPPTQAHILLRQNQISSLEVTEPAN